MDTNLPPFLICAVLMGGMMWASVAQAAHNYTDYCASRADMVREMEDDYGEVQTDVATERSGLLLEVWRGQKNGTPSWTIILTRSDGTSCVIAAGEDWLHSRDALPTGRGI